MMITRQLIFKTLCKISKQRLTYLRNFYSLQSEQQPFKHPQLNTASVNCLWRDQPFRVLVLFKCQLQTGLFKDIDEVTVTLAIKACQGDLKLVCQMHGFAISSGFISYITVSNCLMSMYSKSGQVKKALCIFESLCYPDVVSWNTILSGCQKSRDTFNFALRMNSNGILFDPVTYATVLAFCSDHNDFLFGTQLHSNILKHGLDCEIFVGNALISMYSRCKKLLEARRVFDEMVMRDLVSWNALLSGYTQQEVGLEATLVFIEMVREGFQLDHVSLTGAISACGHERNLELGSQIHSLSVKSGYGTHLSVCNVLISTYSKCGAIEDAQLVFYAMDERNVVSWTTMISMNEHDAMYLFNKMRINGVYPNDVTFVGLIHALSVRNFVKEGPIIHGLCIKAGFLSELNVCNSLITMYAKFESMQASVKVFEELNCRETISWNSLISGFAQNRLYQKALEIFLLAITESEPNHYTFGSVLSAIADSQDISLEYGQRCHSFLIKLGINTDPIISGALLDMYAKRGSICASRRVFLEAPHKSQFSWTAIISAYAAHGDFESVINLFREMEREGIKPDSITFLSVLTVCSRKGLVEMGSQLFDSMVKDYLIEPSPEHYCCVVDMLGRAGELEEAEKMLQKIPGNPGLSVLQSLLGACTMHGNVEMAERVADALMELEPVDSSSYVMMSNLYAEKGNWEKVAKVRRAMREKGVKKEIGFSWVDIGGSLSLHGFSSGDWSHPKFEEIRWMAKCLGLEIKFLRDTEERPLAS